MKNTVRHFCVAAAGLGAIAILGAQAPSEPQQPPPSTEVGIKTTISGEPGAPPHYAVPDFIALTNDKETAEAAKLIAQVLWDDLSFEREFDMIPRDTYRTIETTPTTDTIAFDRWRELGADGVIKGSVRRTGNTFQVEMRLFNVRARGVALGRVYDNVSLRNPRAAAHTMSDEIHQTQANLRGVARTKLTYISDRDNERVVDTVETRSGQRGLRHRLRWRQSDAGHRQSAVERRALLVTRRAQHRLHVICAHTAPDHRVERVPRHPRNVDGRKDRRVFFGVLPRRQANRLHVAARRQLGDLRDESRWLGREAAYEQFGSRVHADVVADRAPK